MTDKLTGKKQPVAKASTPKRSKGYRRHVRQQKQAARKLAAGSRT